MVFTGEKKEHSEYMSLSEEFFDGEECFLLEREKEVEVIMLAMYDEEEILLDYIRSEKYEVAKETAVQMLKMGKLSNEEIVQYVPSLTLEDVERIQRELLQSV